MDFNESMYLTLSRDATFFLVSQAPDYSSNTPSNSSSLTNEDLADSIPVGDFNVDSMDTRSTVELPLFEHFHRAGRTGRVTSFRKDYYRSQHIRALKKSIRQLSQKKFPVKSIHRIDPMDPKQSDLWNKLRVFYYDNSNELTEISATLLGPAIDNPKNVTQGPVEKTYNNSYVSRFFSNKTVRQYNFLFTELVFSVPPEEMCSKMHAKCCREAPHTDSCEQRWRELKRWTQGEMLTEVGVKADSPRSLA